MNDACLIIVHHVCTCMLQEDIEVVMYDIIDEVTLGLIFDVHRSCKLGTLFLGDTDPK